MAKFERTVYTGRHLKLRNWSTTKLIATIMLILLLRVSYDRVLTTIHRHGLSHHSILAKAKFLPPSQDGSDRPPFR